MSIKQKTIHLLLALGAVFLNQACTKSTPPPSEENADPPMVSMEAAVPEEEPAGLYSLAIAKADQLTAGKPISLKLELKKAGGQACPKLKDKDTNLLIVGHNNKDFQRIKPIQVSPGNLSASVIFPHDGEFNCCLQFTTIDGKNYSVVTPLKVGSGMVALAKMSPDTLKTKEVDGFLFQLMDAPEQASDKLISMPTFRITKDKRPVSNIEPIDGKAGYAVFVKEGGKKFLRAIPVTNQSANKLFQQPLMFHVKIDEPGIYSMWTQVKIEGALHTVEYVLNIAI
jgi:hypothetical protein